MGGGTIGTPIPSTATATTVSGRTLFPLDLWRKEMGLNPWHFWQLANGATPVTSSCSDLFSQYAWQAVDRAGRADLMEAIESAVQKLTDHLGYAPFPRYGAQMLQWPRYNDVRVRRYPYSDATGRFVNVKLAQGYVQALGVESLAAIDLDAAVVYTDGDSDGLKETFTVTVPTTLTDVSQIAVYFSPADRLDDDTDRWRVEPVRVVIAAGTATITGNSWLLVKPVLFEGVNSNEIDPGVAANFVTNVAVYRRTTYQAGTLLTDCQAEFVFESAPFPCFCSTSGNGSSDPAAEAYAVGRGGVRDGREGIVYPAEALYDASTGIWSTPALNSCWRDPDRVLVRYLAGYPLVNGQIDRTYARVVCRLAAAELGRPICACEWANKEVARWQVDLARTSGNNDDQYGAISPDDLANPFGTRRGQVEAWKFVTNQAIRPTTLF